MDKFAAIEASRLARMPPTPEDPGTAPAVLSPEQRELVTAAEQSIVALRAVLSQVAPSPSWRAELADMTADALNAAKGVIARDTWSTGWRLVYFARDKPDPR